jgi:hypothetical protein
VENSKRSSWRCVVGFDIGKDFQEIILPKIVGLFIRNAETASLSFIKVDYSDKFLLFKEIDFFGIG